MSRLKFERTIERGGVVAAKYGLLIAVGAFAVRQAEIDMYLADKITQPTMVIGLSALSVGVNGALLAGMVKLHQWTDRVLRPEETEPQLPALPTEDLE